MTENKRYVYCYEAKCMCNHCKFKETTKCPYSADYCLKCNREKDEHVCECPFKVEDKLGY